MPGAFTYREYRVPVRLTAGQKSEIRRLRDGQRHAYNWAVSRLHDGWERNDEYGLCNELTVQRAAHGHIRNVPRRFQTDAIRDAFLAARLAARYGRGHVRYRTKRRASRYALKCSLPPVVVNSCTLKMPVFGTVACKGPVPRELLDHEPRSYEFVDASADRRGEKPRYVLYVACRVNIPEPWSAPATPVAAAARRTVKGIDRGAVEPTVVVALDQRGEAVDKTSYDTASPFKSNRAWCQRQQRKMSKMNRRSRRCKRMRDMVRRRMYRVANRRNYAECVAAKHVCVDYNPHTIVFEDMSLGGMTRKGKGRYKRGLNREMRFVRHHAVAQRIRNKAELMGITIQTVNPQYTSQECARCGHTARESRITRDMFRCVKCHYIQQADVNAAMIIGRRGLPSAPDHTMHGAGTPEAGTPFVRRELDARLGCFTKAGGVLGRRDSQAPAHHLARGMEKERQKMQYAAGRS